MNILYVLDSKSSFLLLDYGNFIWITEVGHLKGNEGSGFANMGSASVWTFGDTFKN